MARGRIFIIIFIFMGLFAIAWGTVRAREAIQAKSWPVASGTIIKSKVTEVRISDSGIRVARLCLELDYIYLVGDKIYDGHRLNAGWHCFGSQSMVEDVIARYPTGKQVKVYYNPKNPASSMLEPGLDWSIFFLWGVGLVTVSVMWPFLRRQKKI